MMTNGSAGAEPFSLTVVEVSFTSYKIGFLREAPPSLGSCTMPARRPKDLARVRRDPPCPAPRLPAMQTYCVYILAGIQKTLYIG